MQETLIQETLTQIPVATSFYLWLPVYVSLLFFAAVIFAIVWKNRQQDRSDNLNRLHGRRLDVAHRARMLEVALVAMPKRGDGVGVNDDKGLISADVSTSVEDMMSSSVRLRGMLSRPADSRELEGADLERTFLDTAADSLNVILQAVEDPEGVDKALLAAGAQELETIADAYAGYRR